MPKKKRGVPEKSCPECSAVNHARSSNCKSCDYEFYIRKNKQREIMAANWKELKAGDIIKCLIGSGPYFISKVKEGEKIYMGQKGKFEVLEIWDDGPKSRGIIGRPLFSMRRACYQEFIYMGESYYDDDMSTHREPHKIKVIKKQS